jgi:CoA-transferase family III
VTAVSALWQQAGLPPEALARLQLTGADPVFPSSFAVGTVAQASMAACALAASELGGQGAGVALGMEHAALECSNIFAIDGVEPSLWDKYSGLYRAGDGWVRIHANFAHHRDGALALLGLQAGDGTSKADVEKALQRWRAQDFEAAAAERGLVVAALRTHAQWQAHPQAQALAQEPLFAIKRIAAYAQSTLTISQNGSENAFASTAKSGTRPLQGLRVLDLTRILAGPVCGRALAAYGADVLMVNSPRLPNISAIADTSRGKRSALLDLTRSADHAALCELVRSAHVFVQGYRPGGLEALGLGPQELARLNPGIVCVSLSAYGSTGPWANRRGFDSLVQTATGINHDESLAAGIDTAVHAPQVLPMQILDHATGYLMAFAAQAALLRQRREGGAWHVQLSLARTAQWLRELGRLEGGLAAKKPDVQPYLYTEPSGFGALTAVRHAVRMGGAPCTWALPSMPPGSHAPQWLD